MVMLNLWTFFFFFFWPLGLVWFLCSRDCGLKWLVICVPSSGHHTIYIGVHVPKSYRRRRRHKRKTGHREKKEKERISENYSDKSDVENADESSSSILKPLSEFPLGAGAPPCLPPMALGKTCLKILGQMGRGAAMLGCSPLKHNVSGGDAFLVPVGWSRRRPGKILSRSEEIWQRLGV